MTYIRRQMHVVELIIPKSPEHLATTEEMDYGGRMVSKVTFSADDLTTLTHVLTAWQDAITSALSETAAATPE